MSRNAESRKTTTDNLSEQQQNGERTNRKRLLNLPAIFDRQPELLYKSPYINFLREFRLTRLDYALGDLYREAAIEWNRLTPAQKKLYRYTEIIKDIKHRRVKRIKRERRRIQARKRRRARRNLGRGVRRRDRRRLYPLRSRGRVRSRSRNRRRIRNRRRLRRRFVRNLRRKRRTGRRWIRRQKR